MGTAWPNSGTIERDNNDNRAVAAKAYFCVGGTSTPLAVFADAGEATPRTDPVVADGYGRWPITFIPFCTSYDVRVTTSGGTQLYYYREIPNPDPVEAAADTVDDTQLIQTGFIIFSPKTGTQPGFVRLNGRTIGSATSGATERANADTEDLYTFNWDNFADGICAVAGGRGGSAAADWAANKAIALLDGRSGVLRGVDDMGNTAASLLGLATFTTGNATTGGSVAGANTHALTEAQLATHLHAVSITSAAGGSHTHTGTTAAGGSHNHTGTTGDDSPDHAHAIAFQSGNTFTVAAGQTAIQAGGSSNTGGASARHQHTFTTSTVSDHTHTFTTGAVSDHTHAVSGNTANTGSGTAHNNVSKSILGTHLQKL